jgi:hypothetical protein
LALPRHWGGTDKDCQSFEQLLDASSLSLPSPYAKMVADAYSLSEMTWPDGDRATMVIHMEETLKLWGTRRLMGACRYIYDACRSLSGETMQLAKITVKKFQFEFILRKDTVHFEVTTQGSRIPIAANIAELVSTLDQTRTDLLNELLYSAAFLKSRMPSELINLSLDLKGDIWCMYTSTLDDGSRVM